MVRKLLTFLTTLTAAVAVIVLFTACEQFLKDPEDFLSYWASEAFIKDHSIGAVARPDEAGVPCVSSSPEVHIMLTVHNPKNFPLVMPTSWEPAGIVEFKELSQQPTEGTHYVLGQTAPGRLKLTYKEAFYEQGSGSLNPTITLKATDGRVFKKTYTFGIKSNTPPPKPAVVLAKQTNTSPNYYVLCIDTKDLSDMVGGKYIHDDIAYVTVNGTSYGLEMNDTHNGFSKKPAAPSFLADGTGLTPDGTESLPSGAWVLYYKTEIQIGLGNLETSYTVTLRDKGGVTSDGAAATIEANSSTHTVTFKVVDEEGGTLTGSYGSTSQTASGSSTATLTVPRGENVTFAAAPALGWKVDSWSSNVNVDSSDNKKATLSNVSDDETVTVKFKKVGTVAGSDMNAWTLLKNAVKVADPNSTITIDGKITASIGNSGQIEINKPLKIKGKTGAENDILDASKMSRIFKVENGANLILENLTLTGGKANGDEDAGSGGAIFARDANDIKIKNCIITGNEAETNGGGIYVESTPTTITNCIFTRNTAIDGGGIYINKTGSSTPAVTISGGTIGGVIGQANEATRNGGGIYVGQSCILNLKDSTGSGAQSVLITGNRAANGKGVYAANNATVSMQGGTRINVYNDVYLDSRSGISVENALTATGTVARIKVPENNYTTSTQVLYGSTALLNSQHGKFEVMPKGNQQWEVNSFGFLKPKY
ncbi:hypothetical protein E4N80_06645 [Treponema denticola]|uniref:right-handed parallel beta-helix repeat-containing protein n=1 Tax=Treponema denticola TaxID=158 RepID=UPI0020A3C076|nr:right-handed parallel beta-helix repeat-containing protein [Treponema denticola]UTD05181.1 hypothetical protein E4N80_06645 [Treponema denticola]